MIWDESMRRKRHGKKIYPVRIRKRKKGHVSYSTLMSKRMASFYEVEKNMDRNTLMPNGTHYLGASLVFDFLQYYWYVDIRDSILDKRDLNNWRLSPYQTLCEFYKFLQFRREEHGTKNRTTEDYYYTVAEAAKMFGISKYYIYKAIRLGELNAICFTEPFNNAYKFVRIPKESIDRWIKLHKYVPFTKDGTLKNTLLSKGKNFTTKL